MVVLVEWITKISNISTIISHRWYFTSMKCAGSFLSGFSSLLVVFIAPPSFVSSFRLPSLSQLPINNMGNPKTIFGAASFGMSFVTLENVQEVLDYLKENNITHLDTAGRYPPTSPGRSEELIGESKAASQGFTIDTKILTLSPDHLGELTRPAIEKSLNTSLQRMGVEQVNTLHVHFPDMATPLEEQAETFDSLHRAGKFKNVLLPHERSRSFEYNTANTNISSLVSRISSQSCCRNSSISANPMAISSPLSTRVTTVLSIGEWKRSSSPS